MQEDPKDGSGVGQIAFHFGFTLQGSQVRNLHRPPEFLTNKKASLFRLAFSFPVAGRKLQNFARKVGQARPLSPRQRDVSAVRPAFEAIHCISQAG